MQDILKTCSPWFCSGIHTYTAPMALSRLKTRPSAAYSACMPACPTCEERIALSVVVYEVSN